MKTLKLIASAWVITLMSVHFTSCKYDDQELWDNYNRLEERVTQLEILCQQNNENIASLQTIVDVLQSGDYVTDLVPITGDNIVFCVATKSILRFCEAFKGDEKSENVLTGTLFFIGNCSLLGYPLPKIHL